MFLNYNKFFKMVAIVASTVVLASFFFELYYALKPCKLCLIQRFTWIFIAIISYFAILQDSFKNFFILLSVLSLTTLTLVSFYHSGVEAGIIANVFACAPETGLNAVTIEELSKIIMNTENNDCAFPKFTFYGITLANFGAFASLILLLSNLLLLKKLLF